MAFEAVRKYAGSGGKPMGSFIRATGRRTAQISVSTIAWQHLSLARRVQVYLDYDAALGRIEASADDPSSYSLTDNGRGGAGSMFSCTPLQKVLPFERVPCKLVYRLDGDEVEAGCDGAVAGLEFPILPPEAD